MFDKYLLFLYLKNKHLLKNLFIKKNNNKYVYKYKYNNKISNYYIKNDYLRSIIPK